MGNDEMENVVKDKDGNSPSNNYSPEYLAELENWGHNLVDRRQGPGYWAEMGAGFKEFVSNFRLNLFILAILIVSLIPFFMNLDQHIATVERHMAYLTGPDGIIPKIEVKFTEVSGKFGAKVDELLEPDPNWPPAKSGQKATKPVTARQAGPVAPMPGFVLVDNPNHVPGQEMFTGEPEHLCVAFTAENGKAVAQGVVDMENCLRQGQ